MAYDLDGTNDYLLEVNPTTLGYPLTFSIWFNSDLTGVNRTLMSFAEVGPGAGSGTNDQNSQFLRITTANVVEARSATSGGVSAAATTNTISLNTWHHAAGKFNSSTSRQAFLDGVGSTINSTTRTAANLDNVIIGRNAGGSFALDQAFNGRLAEVAIWTASLDAAEIEALADGYSPRLVRPSELAFYVPMVRSEQDIVSGNAVTVSEATVAVHTRRIG